MSWLDDILDTIKSGQWTEGKTGDVIEGGLQALSRAAPFPNLIKSLAGDQTINKDLSSIADPVPEILSDPVKRSLAALRNYSPDMAKLAEDTMINTPFMVRGPMKPQFASDPFEILSKETGSTPILDDILKSMKEEPRPSKLTTFQDISKPAMKIAKPVAEEGTIESTTKPTFESSVKPQPTPLSQKLKGWFSDLDEVTPRELGRGIMREESGKIAQTAAQEGESMAKDLGKWFTKSPKESQDFIRKIEQGKLNEIPDLNDRAIAYEMSNGWLKRRNIIDDLGEKDGTNYFESYVKNYFPHMFEDPKQAASVLDRVFNNRTAAEGSKDFLRTRNIDSFDEAIDLYHLTPRTWNPVEMGLMKNAEMDRFIMAHQVKNQFLEEGLIKPAGEDVPRDWVRLNDQLFNGKQFWAPQDVAKDFNHYFSPGMMGNPLYDFIRGASNSMTQAQLGLSGFHAIFESLESGVSDLALATQQAKQGQLGEAGKSVGRAMTVVGPAARDFVAGQKMMAEYLKPGSFQQYAREAKAIAESGGRITMDPIYLNKSINAFKGAIANGNWAKAIAKSIPAAMEAQAKPIMEYYVPRVKLGAFQKMAANVLERAEKEGWTEDLTRRELQKTWDSVDNRFGQLVYSNLFWHKAAKDLALVTVRAPGWNLGTIRELGGGLLDLTQQTGRAIAEQRFDITHRMAYTMMMPVFAGYIGSLINFFMTGEPPKELKDFYFPRDGTFDRNGNPNRIQVPSYLKDVLHMASHPVKTALGKLNPAITSAVDLLNNHDFYNVQVRHPQDPIANQAVDVAKYLAEEMTPFSLRNYKQRGSEGVGELIQSLVGILPAPREFVKTPAENLTTEYLQRHTPSGPITPDEARQREVRRDLESSFRRGQIGVADLVKAVGKGAISHKQLESMVKYKNLPTISRDIKQLTAEEALDVYKAANQKEKPLILHDVRRIVARKMSTADPDHRAEWADKLLSLGAGPNQANEPLY